MRLWAISLNHTNIKRRTISLGGATTYRNLNTHKTAERPPASTLTLQIATTSNIAPRYIRLKSSKLVGRKSERSEKEKSNLRRAALEMNIEDRKTKWKTSVPEKINKY